jgi:DNA helicase-2/ATP-dependent DNA helicase PcrA
MGHDSLFAISTIHSFMWTLIKPFQVDIKKAVIDRINTRLSKLKAAADGFTPRVRPGTREKNAADTARYQKYLVAIEPVRRFTYEAGRDYARGILGHDDVLNIGPTLIETSPLLRRIAAHAFPVIFVDESQDTMPDVVRALNLLAESTTDKFTLGFFGDPMQQIYPQGIGAIKPFPKWREIEKPENYRCSKAVLDVVNNVRAKGDDLHQITGLKPPSVQMEGSARLFVLPADKDREAHLAAMRTWQANSLNDPDWLSDDPRNGVKILVIVHSMAAQRLGFDELYNALSQGDSSFTMGLAEGSLWATAPFRSFVVPVIEAWEAGRHFEVMNLLRRYTPAFRRTPDATISDPEGLLKGAKAAVEKLASQMKAEGGATIREVLEHIATTGLFNLDQRLVSATGIGKKFDPAAVIDPMSIWEISDENEVAMADYLKCPAVQLRSYFRYIEGASLYSTQQGVKGAEFERVLVIVDEERNTHRQFSYDKLFGLAPLSKTDSDNAAAGE